MASAWVEVLLLLLGSEQLKVASVRENIRFNTGLALACLKRREKDTGSSIQVSRVDWWNHVWLRIQWGMDRRQNLLETGLLRGAAGQMSVDMWSLYCMKHGEKQTSAKTQKSPLSSTDCQHYLALVQMVLAYLIAISNTIFSLCEVRDKPKSTQFKRA